MHDENHEGHHKHVRENDPEHGVANDVKKLKVLLEHWIEHNASHAQNYVDWAQKAVFAQKDPVAQELRSAAELTERISEHFRKARDLI